MKKLFAVIMAVLMMICMTGCEKNIKCDIVGTWSIDEKVDSNTKKKIVQACGFSEEELEFTDENELFVVKTIKFDKKGNYIVAYDVEKTKEKIKDYFDKYVETLHNNVDKLAEFYGEGSESTSVDEFKYFIADACEFETFDEFTDAVSGEIVSGYLGNDATVEKGTYTEQNGNLVLTDATGEITTVGLDAKQDKLTLKYSDGEEEYTKVK